MSDIEKHLTIEDLRDHMTTEIGSVNARIDGICERLTALPEKFATRDEITHIVEQTLNERMSRVPSVSQVDDHESRIASQEQRMDSMAKMLAETRTDIGRMQETLQSYRDSLNAVVDAQRELGHDSANVVSRMNLVRDMQSRQKTAMDELEKDLRRWRDTQQDSMGKIANSVEQNTASMYQLGLDLGDMRTRLTEAVGGPIGELKREVMGDESAGRKSLAAQIEDVREDVSPMVALANFLQSRAGLAILLLIASLISLFADPDTIRTILESLFY